MQREIEISTLLLPGKLCTWQFLYRNALPSRSQIYAKGENDMKIVEYKLDKKLIGLISDTHIPKRGRYIPPKVFEIFDRMGVELILHAGDLVEEKVLIELSALAPVESVAGNMDSLETREKLGEIKVIQSRDFSIAVVHGEGPRHEVADWAFNNFRNSKVDVIVFGHSHMPHVEYRENVLLVNPGSPVDPRGGSDPSCGSLFEENGVLKAKNFSLK